MTAYYNEFDPNAAAWLRELIKAGLIADGDVDDRSILDVEPSDLRAYQQHHFFAGIGGWSYSLRLAGWSDDRAVCTASLPCQPFSSAGKQLGKSDERHLLPHFIELVKRCDFPVIFGEQVPAAIGHGWLDDLCDEMEREAYSVGAIVLTAAGAGAPHIRQRLYWVTSRLCNAKQSGLERHARHENAIDEQGRFKTQSTGSTTTTSEPDDRMGDSENKRFNWREDSAEFTGRLVAKTTNWSNLEWINCRDGKQRPIKPSTIWMVDGVSRGMGHCSDPNNTQEARVMRLKGYGNAIVPQVAASFIQTYMDITQ